MRQKIRGGDGRGKRTTIIDRCDDDGADTRLSGKLCEKQELAGTAARMMIDLHRICATRSLVRNPAGASA